MTEERQVKVADTSLSQPAQRGAKGKVRLGAAASIAVAAILVSLLILKFAPEPFFWVWLTWAGIFFLAANSSHGEWRRASFSNLAIFACLLAAAEAYCLAHEFPANTMTNGFSVSDGVLGWAPQKGMRAHAAERVGGLFRGPGRSIYDVEYTIDSDGLRIAPPRSGALSGSILFFGDSFTFGYGVDDTETLPYQIGVQSGGSYRTFNFAFLGYSPAQMLAAIEHGIVRGVVNTNPDYAFYIAIPDHVSRVAGLKTWIKHQPRYVLDADGTVHSAGFFEDPMPLALRLGLGRRVAAQVEKSAIWRTLSLREPTPTDYDKRLYFALIRRSRDLLAAQYPGIKFRIILWPGDDAAQRSAAVNLPDGFRQMGIAVDLVEEILPGYTSQQPKYVLSSLDPHPNPLANRLLAQYVLDKILQ